jgi:hypothetical protein
LRAAACGAALRAGADGFDFAAVFSAVFLDFATALAMSHNDPKRGKKLGALHHFDGFRASRETLVSQAIRDLRLYVKPAQQAQAHQADEDQVDRHNEIEQSRHDQDQNPRDQGNDGRHMRSGDGHSKAPVDAVENRIEGGSLAATAFSREAG